MTSQPRRGQVRLCAEVEELASTLELRAGFLFLPDVATSRFLGRTLSLSAATRKKKATELLAWASRLRREAGPASSAVTAQLIFLAGELAGVKGLQKSLKNSGWGRGRTPTDTW